MALKLWGERAVRFLQSPAASADGDDASLPDVLIPNAPGTVYLGGVTGAVLAVTHTQSAQQAYSLTADTL